MKIKKTFYALHLERYGLFVGFLDEGNSKEFPALKISLIFSAPRFKLQNYVHNRRG
jgi:hypothetical protein